MREIKYRGQISNGEWVYGELIEYESGQKTIINDYNESEVIPETIEAFNLFHSCLNCKYEPRWDKDNIGQCRWDKEGVVWPEGLCIVAYNDIKKDYPFKFCRAWREKV